MSQALFYTSTAAQMQLTAPMGSGDTTCQLNTTTGLPVSFPFKLLIDWGAGSQEVVYVTSLTGLTPTITRGQDGTTAQVHSVGAIVVHGVSAEEFNTTQAHLAATQNVHGVGASSSVVGTATTQTLTNKTLTSPTITTPTVNGSGGLLTLPTGPATLVGRTTTDTLTNKTLTGAVLDSTTTWDGVTGTAFGGAWTAYTPTFTNCTSPTGSFAYRLTGKTLQIRAAFTGGTVTTNAQVGIGLPASAAGVAAAAQTCLGWSTGVNGGLVPWSLPASGTTVSTILTNPLQPGSGLATQIAGFSATFEIA